MSNNIFQNNLSETATDEICVFMVNLFWKISVVHYRFGIMLYTWYYQKRYVLIEDQKLYTAKLLLTDTSK